MQNHLAVHVNNVTKSYGSSVILENLNMHVEEGTIYGLLGSSGCGKTTLLGCITGTKKYQKGTIKLLGKDIDGVPGDKVGYMPQEVALINEFTVKDSIYFFGRIYKMDSKTIEERYYTLKKLLELPSEDRIIENCSGGEKRRISFAVALVHSPQLLILDEPSVGVDPILRERIWDYLIKLTKTKKSSVIVTTHYIDEARVAHKIGFLRKGTIIKEEAPTKLMNDFGCQSLEDVFFRLSDSQEKSLAETNQFNSVGGMDNTQRFAECSRLSTETLEADENSKQISSQSGKHNQAKKSKFALYRLHALIYKNYRQILRNKLGYFALTCLPVIQLWIIFLSVGRNIPDMPLAIVNEESNCTDINSTVTGDNNWQCHIKSISCRLLEYLEDPIICKKYYNDLATATEAVRTGTVIGVVHINKNISALMEYRINNNSPKSFKELTTTEIDVYMDMSLIQMGGELKHKIADLYTKFADSIYSDCGLAVKAGRLPINIQEQMFYVERDTYVVFLTPGLLLSMVFYVGIFLTSFIIVMEKSIGIWERSIIAGVTTSELFVSHMLVQSFQMLLITISILFSVFLIFGNIFYDKIFNMFMLIYLQGLTGLFFGYFISTFCNSYMMVNALVTSLMYPVTSLGGTFWPVEGMPIILQIISKASPLTLATEAFRNVMMKGWSLFNPQVLMGICVPILWVILLAILSIYFVKIHR